MCVLIVIKYFLFILFFLYKIPINNRILLVFNFIIIYLFILLFKNRYNHKKLIFFYDIYEHL